MSRYIKVFSIGSVVIKIALRGSLGNESGRFFPSGNLMHSVQLIYSFCSVVIEIARRGSLGDEGGSGFNCLVRSVFLVGKYRYLRRWGLDFSGILPYGMGVGYVLSCF